MKGKDTTVKISTLLGSGTQIEGDFTAEGSTRVDGIINGNVTIQGAIIVGAEGKINGTIVADAATIGGEVIGDVTVTEKLEILATAKIIGDITSKVLVIDEHAVFQGNCNMNQEVPNGKRTLGRSAAKAAVKAGKKSAKTALEEALKEVKDENSSDNFGTEEVNM